MAPALVLGSARGFSAARLGLAGHRRVDHFNSFVWRAILLITLSIPSRDGDVAAKDTVLVPPFGGYAQLQLRGEQGREGSRPLWRGLAGPSWPVEALSASSQLPLNSQSGG